MEAQQRQQLVARAADAEGAPQLQRVVVAQAAQKQREAARDRVARDIVLKLGRVEAGAHQNP